MDLGIADKNAIVAASSAGLGFACAESLAKEGVNVVINGRDQDRLDAAAEKLRLIAKGTVTSVVGDIALEETRIALLPTTRSLSRLGSRQLVECC
jgi:3-oxoacyl-[acyl-carrier protein] reductase